MTDMPFILRTLPPEVLDVLRYYGRSRIETAHYADIMNGSNLGDRTFGKALRRLVTKQYLAMEGSQVYRLTKNGRGVMQELMDYEANAPQSPQFSPVDSSVRFVRRGLVLAAPAILAAGQPTTITVGIAPAAKGDAFSEPLNLLISLSVVHGEPARARDTSLLLTNDAARQPFEIAAGLYRQARVRLSISQLSDESGDFERCGGLYADLDVSATPGDAPLVAFTGEIVVSGR